MTATQLPLEEILAQRARELFERYPEERRLVLDGMHYVPNGLIGDWYVYESEWSEKPLGEAWFDRLEEIIRTYATVEFERLVLPAVGRRVAAWVAENPPPAHLMAHEAAGRLRADLSGP